MQRRPSDLLMTWDQHHTEEQKLVGVPVSLLGVSCIPAVSGVLHSYWRFSFLRSAEDVISVWMVL